MRVEQRADPTKYLAEALPLLLADEARHNLLLGIAGTLVNQPDAYPSFHLWLVEGDSGPVTAAVRTPPHNLVLAGSEDGAALLAERLATDGLELPGITANLPEVDRFVERWRAETGALARERMRQRVYALEAVRPPHGVSGTAREASEIDREVLVTWIGDFAAELADVSSPTVDAERTVDLRMSSGRGGFLLWEDEAPVSMAGWGSPTPNGIRIGPVYTPPEHRRRGYGSAVTAAASARNLAAGRRLCFLYTDLANPTSNKIYMDIGYEPVCESVEYAFEQP